MKGSSGQNVTVLLTGGTGFVGRQVLRHLLRMGARVRMVVRGGRDARPDLPRAVECIETADLFAEEAQWWADACAGVDIIVHVAWYAEPGEYLHSPKNLHCLSGTLELARGALQAGVRRFVGVGTCFEYDLKACVLSVDTPLRPASVYAAAKASVYLTLSAWLPRAGMELAWCRLFYLHGEGEDSRRLIPHIRNCLEAGQPVKLGDGRFIRDYMDVAQAGAGIARIALSDRCGAFNICSGEPVTIRQLAERIADEYGQRQLLQFNAVPPREGDPFCVVGIPNMPDDLADEEDGR